MKKYGQKLEESMDYKVEIFPIAKQDLLDIAAYLSQFYESTFAKFIESFERQIGHLAQMPYMGTVHRNFRRLIVSDYLVFYVVNEETRTVEVRSIIHGTRNISAHLNVSE